MILNGPSFIRQLDKASDEAGDLSLQFQKRIALEGLKRVVQRTPVDTGRARGGWQVARSDNDVDTGQRDGSGASTVSAGLSIINRVTIPFGEIVIFNNVRYIVFLEEGSSGQAPQGMVDVTLRELQLIAEQAGFQGQFQFTADVQRSVA
jgi:hypothetical protein